MLIEFKVANHRSIRTEQTLSFIASNYTNALSQNIVDFSLPGFLGAKLLKAAAVYGANASGKSNLIAALHFLVGFVRNSGTSTKPDWKINRQQFKLDPVCKKSPTTFEIQAVISGVRMLYGLKLTDQRVISEYLVGYPNGRPQVWFERAWKNKKYSWSRQSTHFPHDKALHSKTRDNVSFLAIAAQFNHKQARTVWDWFEQAFHFVGDLDDSARIAELFENDTWRQRAVEALIKADFGISGAKVRKEKDDTQEGPQILEFEEHFDRAMAVLLKDSGKPFKSFTEIRREKRRAGRPELLHRGKNHSEIPMDFLSEESSGTRRFLSILGEYLRDAEHARIMIVDELETSLHPLLVREIISLFSESGPKGGRCAQLLFTTHNPLLLDQSLLRRDQIWFTEKDAQGATRLYPLTDFKPRHDEALAKGYLAGRYGGIPFIPKTLAFEK
jgi:uncharacterized protein